MSLFVLIKCDLIKKSVTLLFVVIVDAVIVVDAVADTYIFV